MTKLKRILAFAAFVAILIFHGSIVHAETNQNASTGFTKLYLGEAGKETSSLTNNEIVHGYAVFKVPDQLPLDGVMKVSWPSNSNVTVKGFKQSKDLQIKGIKIGQYNVTDDGVTVKFNDQAKHFKDISGYVDFFIQVKNLTQLPQKINLQAGAISKNLTVKAGLKPADMLAGQITSELNSQQNTISWEIKLNQDQQDFTDQLAMLNPIPQGLRLKTDSLKVLIDGQSLDVSTFNRQYAGQAAVIRSENNAIKATFKAAKFAKKPIVLQYDTAIIASEKPAFINEVQLTYQLKPLTAAHLVSIFGLQTVKQTEEQIVGTPRGETETIDPEQLKNKTLTFLLKLANWLKEPEEEKSTSTQKSNLAQSEKQQTLVNEKNPATKTTKASQSSVPLHLTGFKTKTQAPKNTVYSKRQTPEQADQETTTKIVAVKTPRRTTSDQEKRSKNLPQAGQTNTGLIVSLAGIILFTTALIGLKFRK